MVKYWAIVPAAGIGSRMGASIPKQYLPLLGRTVLEHTLSRLASHPAIAGMVVALSPEDVWWPAVHVTAPISIQTVPGGSERCYSVLNALDLLAQTASPEDWVLVHDAARPCLRLADIDRLISELGDHSVGGLLGLPCTNTKKRTDATGNIIATVSRDGLWRALTPQMFRLGMLRDALTRALAAGVMVTDEASAMEWAGLMPRMVEGHSDNIKITRPEDLTLAALFLQHQESSQ